MVAKWCSFLNSSVDNAHCDINSGSGSTEDVGTSGADLYDDVQAPMELTIQANSDGNLV